MNTFENIEQTVWNEIKAFHGGGIPAVYRQVKTGTDIVESETPVFVMPIDPTPDSFGFEDFRIYKTSRVYETEKAGLNGIVPKENDVILFDNVSCYVKKSQSGPCWTDVGFYGVTIKIHTTKIHTT